MKTIFLDLGAYNGDTAQAALKYGIFDIVHSFEPVESLYKHIETSIKDKRLILHKYGLLDKDCEKIIYCSGSVGGSIFKNKKQKGNKGPPVNCMFKKSSDWFRNNISKEDCVLVKMNVEGAEISILNDLIDSGEYFKIDNIMICFDILKIPGGDVLFDEIINKFKKFNIRNYTITGDMKKLARKPGKKNTMEDLVVYWLKNIVKK
jgi:FkbM family methyltransferase